MSSVGALMWFLAIAAIGIAVHWAFMNAKAGNSGPTKGLLAMRDRRAEDENKEETNKKKRKSGPPPAYGVQPAGQEQMPPQQMPRQ